MISGNDLDIRRIIQCCLEDDCLGEWWCNINGETHPEKKSFEKISRSKSLHKEGESLFAHERVEDVWLNVYQMRELRNRYNSYYDDQINLLKAVDCKAVETHVLNHKKDACWWCYNVKTQETQPKPLPLNEIIEKYQVAEELDEMLFAHETLAEQWIGFYELEEIYELFDIVKECDENYNHVIDYFEESIQDLRDCEEIRKKPTKKQKKQMLEVAKRLAFKDRDESFDIYDLIDEVCPEIMAED